MRKVNSIIPNPHMAGRSENKNKNKNKKIKKDSIPGFFSIYLEVM
jgi:hypothetical protein